MFTLDCVRGSLASGAILTPLTGHSLTSIRHLVGVTGASGTGLTRTRDDRLACPCDASRIGRVVTVLHRVFEIRRIVLSIGRTCVTSTSRSSGCHIRPVFGLRNDCHGVGGVARGLSTIVGRGRLGRLVSSRCLNRSRLLARNTRDGLLGLNRVHNILASTRGRH